MTLTPPTVLARSPPLMALLSFGSCRYRLFLATVLTYPSTSGATVIDSTATLATPATRRMAAHTVKPASQPGLTTYMRSLA